MKKRIKLTPILLALILSLGASFTSCKDSETDTEAYATDTPETLALTEDSYQLDISIKDIDWVFENGNIKGNNYVVLQFTNNSNYTIDSLEIKFQEKANLSKEEKSEIYADLQNSQGLDDEWMSEYIASRETLNQPITMYGKSSEPTAPTNSSGKIACAYMGGWTSKEVLHAEKFEPTTAIIKYTKESTAYTIYYNFNTQTYDLESE